MDRVERQVSRHRPRLWRGEFGDARRVRLAVHRIGRPLRARRAAAGRLDNFVTAHDGFTLSDLVSYNDKHNDANGESNNDGESHNRSWNCGVEGPTDDPAVLTLRARQQRNFLATLLLSQGVPMMLHGDELGRIQHGNNNTYAQDSELSWVHWDGADTPLMEFVAAIARLRRQHPTFRRARFFDGRPLRRGEGEALPDIAVARPLPATRWCPTTGTRDSVGRSACSSTARASAAVTRRAGERIID